MKKSEEKICVECGGKISGYYLEAKTGLGLIFYFHPNCYIESDRALDETIRTE